MYRPVLSTALFLVLTASLSAAEPDKDGFVPLFNGKDLTGWVNVNGHPGTWYVKDNMIVTTGQPVGFMRTDKMYENFILEFEWKHSPRKDDREGNSGLFVWADGIPAVGQGSFARAIEVQVLVGLLYTDKKTGKPTATSHGDIFSIHGATCKPDRPHPTGAQRCLPSANHAKGFGEWNHYRVEAKDGRIDLSVNGHKVSGVSESSQRKGYLALEAEGNECSFRNLRIKTLPSTNPKPEETAVDGTGLERLYNGMDLTGWKVEDAHKGHWKAASFWQLTYDGKAPIVDKKSPDLWTEKEYKDFEMWADWKFNPKNAKKMKWPKVLPNGDDVKDELIEVDDAGDSGIYLRGNSKSQVNIWCRPVGSGEVYGYRTDRNMPAEVRRAVTPKERADKPLGSWNRFFIRMKDDRLNVWLNGKHVIEDAQLQGVPAKGPLALQHHGDAIEFGHLYIRELK